MSRILLEKEGKFGRSNEIGTNIRVVKTDDGFVRFEIYQTTKSPFAKRTKNNYVIFNLSNEELAQIWEE